MIVCVAASAPVAFATVPGWVAYDLVALDSGDTGWNVDDTGGAWDTGWADPGCGPADSADTMDTGEPEAWCAPDEKKPPEIVDLKKYPAGKDFPDLPKAVADILVARCATCHTSTSGRGNLQRWDRANKEFPLAGPKAPKITLSEMLKRITQTDDDGKMPPPKGSSPAGTPLTAEQLKALKDWLEKNGAKN